MMVVKKITQIAWPMVGEQVLQVSMGAVDSYVLAHLGVAVLSGVSVANTIVVIYQAIFVAFATAVSRCMSSVAPEDEDSTVAEILSITVFLGLVLGLCSLFLAYQILIWLGADGEVAHFGGLYLAIVGGGVVLLGLMTSLGAYCRAKGQYQMPMRVSLLANILNIVCSVLSVYGFGWGLVGVAVSTVLSRLIAVIILWRCSGLILAAITWRLTLRSPLCRFAYPLVLERLLMRGGDLVLVSLLAGLGRTSLAGNAIGETLTQFSYMPGFAVATAIVILSAQLAPTDKTPKHFLKHSYFVMLVSMMVIAGLIAYHRLFLINLFETQEAVVEVASLLIVLSLLGLPATAGTLSLTAFYQGLGDSKTPFYATALGMWGIRLLGGYCLSHYFGLGVAGLYLGTILDNTFRSVYLYQKLVCWG